jgi:hypothetical protein
LRWTWLIFWGVAGVGMLASSFFVSWFDIDFTYFKLNLGWFALVYAGLLVMRNVLVKQQIEMTPRELHDWGEILAKVTPRILDLAENGSRPKEIAAELKVSDKIPELVSLKYMVALSKQLKKEAEGK